MIDDLRPAPTSCPTCAAPIGRDDAFCEACGSTLAPSPPDGAVVADGPGVAAPDGTAPRTHLLAPASPLGPGATICHVCGAAIDDDGFCSECGQRARSRREHWTESPAPWVGGVCDKGIAHAGNEDAMALYADGSDFAVLVVCDGVTTAPDSDKASLAAAQVACALLAAAARPTGSFATRLTAWQHELGAACAAANEEAVGIAHALGDPPEPPSCTFVAAVVTDDQVSVAWCGDSRAYWVADDAARSTALSIDHSLGTEMIAAGLSREQAEADPTCHTITRWLGADSIDPAPELRTMAREGPGWVLVVSDGMWNYASSTPALAALIVAAEADGASSPTAIAESLAAYANNAGGHDNVTVAIARCGAPLP
ncbi:MAG: PP2C family protein-serine/threonine phosphatase [Actinomycetota bacterium]|jgi:serine/threonine protein phosphatase PrpC/predicted nucleic acid-binding Zn ribbon protein